MGFIGLELVVRSGEQDKGHKIFDERNNSKISKKLKIPENLEYLLWWAALLNKSVLQIRSTILYSAKKFVGRNDGNKKTLINWPLVKSRFYFFLFRLALAILCSTFKKEVEFGFRLAEVPKMCNNTQIHINSRD